MITRVDPNPESMNVNQLTSVISTASEMISRG